MVNIFSVDYYPGEQIKFERALNAGELEEAVGILDGFFLPHTTTERENYSIVMAEGYNAVAKAALSQLDISSQRLAEIIEEDGDLRKYSLLGSPEELRCKLVVLGKYMKFGIPKQVADKLERLNKLEKAKPKKKK